MPNFVLIGHSHAGRLAKAAHEAGRDVRVFVADARHARDGVEIAAEVTPGLDEALTAETVVLSCIGGNAHNTMALLAQDPPFDFVSSETPHLPLDPAAEALPQAAVRATLERRASRQMALLRQVAMAAKGPVFHTESPPPSPAHERFLEALGRLTDKPPARAGLRYKMWRLHSAIVRDACHETGVTFIPHPTNSTDAAGMLSRRHYLNPTHANVGYARLVWRQLDALL